MAFGASLPGAKRVDGATSAPRTRACSAKASASRLAGSSSQRWGDVAAPVTRLPRTRRAMRWRRAIVSRFADATRAAVPSSIHVAATSAIAGEVK